MLELNTLLRRLRIRHPIILAPMAGGPGSPELAAAVSNAGGLGSLGVSYLSPEQIVDTLRQTRALTDGPINLNLFAGGYSTAADFNAETMLSILSEIHLALGIPPPTLPSVVQSPFAEQFEAVLECRPEVFSFTFGTIGPDAISRLRNLGIAIIGTATTVEEGHILAEAGVDAIVAQGAEAGSHRGTFISSFEDSMIPTSELVRQIAAFAPAIASGGIMDGREIADMLQSGATAVQMGTAFLPCPESGAADVYKQALLSATCDMTVITTAFSGRPARVIRNSFIERLESFQDAILPFPLQNTMTRPMRVAAAKRSLAGYVSLYAGQGASRSRQMPAGDLVDQLMIEAQG